MEDPGYLLKTLLGMATLLPLASFFVILLAGKWMGKAAGYVATGAIVGAAVLSFVSFFLVWLPVHREHLGDSHGHDEHAAVINEAPATPFRLASFEDESADDDNDVPPEPSAVSDEDSKAEPQQADASPSDHKADEPHEKEASAGHADEDHSDNEKDHKEAGGEGHGDHAEVPNYYSGEYYLLGKFGKSKLAISYYIDALTLVMFCMVTLIASCIHLYASGYMSDELVDEYTDHEAHNADGSHVKRPGRYHRFFQALSLFCFSMLGLVLAGNIAMVFVFWELVGICSYFLIGFYVERHSASTAANKAFIVNRVGDFGMIIGLMALWAGIGTFAFGDTFDEHGHVVEQGIFSTVRPVVAHDDHSDDGHGDESAKDFGHAPIVPDGMVQMAVPDKVAVIASDHSHQEDGVANAQAQIDTHIDEWRHEGYGYAFLVVAGLGIFCGCVGKSAQFPLHVWLPDAMEGPTPVSALVHSATMVAAGVYLVGRFFPVFAPEVLFIIAISGVITLFMAATIAITATDIKRVLAYSTVSQLGYMMLALGVGGWVAGLMHLITHAFFKSLLFMCSGSVIHAVHTNEMTEMGGLRKKMPITAYTMLIGCLAIAGVSIPFVVGFSGYYSKDMILEQAFSFMRQNDTSIWGKIFFGSALGGAAITAFYMFRMWYLTFAGKPRDQERYDHAHESPASMWVPLVICAVFAVAVAWRVGDHALASKYIPTPILGSLVAIVISALIVLIARSPATDNHHEDDHGHDDDHHGHDHGLPRNLIFYPLILSIGALVVSMIWSVSGNASVNLHDLIAYAQHDGVEHGNGYGAWISLRWPSQHLSHEPEIVVPVTVLATMTALAGIGLATAMYCFDFLSPVEVRKKFSLVYNFLVGKWWFDELYHVIFVIPTQWLGRIIAMFDQRIIDWLLDSLANVTAAFSRWFAWLSDTTIVDGAVDGLASWTYKTGVALRQAQTGHLRQYVMFIVLGTIAVFIIMSMILGASTGLEASDVTQ